MSEESLDGNICGSRAINEATCYKFRWKRSEDEGPLKYGEITNYGRRINTNPSIKNCVMCGCHDVIIPTQNKDVCKLCDTRFWYSPKLDVVFKFCKGCKNFYELDEFRDRPEASKCGKCRQRGRENYITKKLESGYSSSDLMPARPKRPSNIISGTPSPSTKTSVSSVSSTSTQFSSAAASVSVHSCSPTFKEIGNCIELISDAVEVFSSNNASFVPFTDRISFRPPSTACVSHGGLADSASQQRPPKVPRKISFVEDGSSSLSIGNRGIGQLRSEFGECATPTPRGVASDTSGYSKRLSSSADSSDSSSSSGSGDELSYKKRRMHRYMMDEQQQQQQAGNPLSATHSATPCSSITVVTPFGYPQDWTPSTPVVHLSSPISRLGALSTPGSATSQVSQTSSGGADCIRHASSSSSPASSYAGISQPSPPWSASSCGGSSSSYSRDCSDKENVHGTPCGNPNVHNIREGGGSAASRLYKVPFVKIPIPPEYEYAPGAEGVVYPQGPAWQWDPAANPLVNLAAVISRGSPPSTTL